MKTIILDTNALMAIAELNIDIFTEVERVCFFSYTFKVLSGTLEELQKIQQEQRGKFKAAAKLALSILQHKKIAVLPSDGNVDDVLISLSQQGNLILTQDRELKKKLTRPYLTIRQKKMIVLVGG